MLQARCSLIALDPCELGQSVEFIAANVRPVVEKQTGNLGMCLFTNPELGMALLESFWATRDALLRAELSEQADPPGYREALRRASGTVWVDRYRVPVFELDAPLGPAAQLRLTRMHIPPSRVDDFVAVYAATEVPSLPDIEGFRCARLLVDKDCSHAITEVVWRDGRALAASRSIAAAMRVSMAAATGCVIQGVEEYTFSFDSVRKP
ncbi:MAG TPA: hypothetical protein VGI74_12190 [Streptosporangiaceae bacterium]